MSSGPQSRIALQLLTAPRFSLLMLAVFGPNTCYNYDKDPSMNSPKILFGASYTVWTHCDINSCERKKVVIHDVAHCDLILCYVYAMKVISVKWHQVSHTTDSVLLSWLHCSSPSSASRVPIRPGKSHYICKLLGLLFIILWCLFLWCNGSNQGSSYG